MERLTKVDGIGKNELVRCFDCDLKKAGENLENCGMCEESWRKALDRLAAYENTGLLPGELNDMLNEAYDLGYQSCLNYKGMKWPEAEELQRYRDTGLDPEQVKDMAENVENRLLTWFESKYGFSVGELMHIVEAKNNGHLVVLPCPMGTKLWRVVHAPRKKHCTERYYVRQIKMDKTNALRIALEKEYGRTVFPSRTEARKAAAEMNGNRKKGEENED